MAHEVGPERHVSIKVSLIFAVIHSSKRSGAGGSGAWGSGAWGSGAWVSRTPPPTPLTPLGTRSWSAEVRDSKLAIRNFGSCCTPQPPHQRSLALSKRALALWAPPAPSGCGWVGTEVGGQIGPRFGHFGPPGRTFGGVLGLGRGFRLTVRSEGP